MLILLLVVALCGVGTYSVKGKAVSAREFLSAAAPLFLGLALVTFAIAFAIATERRWGRPLLMLALMLPVVGDLWWGTANPSWFEVDFFGLGKVSLSAVGFLLLAAWYLYAKPNVRDYYRALKNPDLVRLAEGERVTH
jgi:hypothetical protein